MNTSQEQLAARRGFAPRRLALGALTLGFAAAGLIGCGGGGGATPAPPPPAAPEYRIGGTVSGLRGTGLQLLNNGDNPTPVAANGSFTFSRTTQGGAPYAVTVAAQPQSPAQVCGVTGGTGTVAAADVANIQVTCADTPPVTMTLRFTSYNPVEAYLWLDTTDNLNSYRFELTADGVLISCCTVWGPSGQGEPGPPRAHRFYLGSQLSPYSNGGHLYVARLLDLAGNEVARSEVAVASNMDNALANGNARTDAFNGWTLDPGVQVARMNYNDSRSLLNGLRDPLPFERFSEATNSTGSYFSTEGTPGGRIEMRQRITVAFPGTTDGSTAVAWGGWFGNQGGGRARMAITFVGENADGAPFEITGAPLGATTSTTTLQRDHAYGRIPANIHYIDVVLTLDAGSGAAFADNLYVSVVPWPR